MVSTTQHSTTLYNTQKMSAIQMIITNIQSLNDTDRAQVLSHFVKGTQLAGPVKEVGANKDLEPKKQNANKGKPTCHGDFVKKILEEQKDAAQAFKEANKEMKGAHLVFVANYKKEKAEEFTAFETAWKEAHPKVATEAAKEPEVVVATEVVAIAEPKIKRVITEEQKAKMKAGREAAKAKKSIEQAAQLPISPAFGAPMVDPVVEPVEEPVEEPVAEPVAAKRRGPKKLDDMTPEERATHEARKAERKAKKAAGLSSGSDTGSDASVPSVRPPSPKLKDE